MSELQRIGSISTDELLEKIDNQNYRIIDVRPVEAYNGWKLRNEKRGGHIKGAKSLPSKWADYIDWIEIVRSKEILTNHSIIVYGYDKTETEKVVNQFIRAGYLDVKVYHNFISEWTTNDKLPMQKLKRYQNLVSANWLNQLIKTGKAPEYDNNKFVICHAYYHNRKAYEEGHIPNAIDLDTNLLESSETWNRRNPEELKKTLEKLGITYDTSVILYGRFSNPDNKDPFPGSSAGHLGAMRCAFIMMYSGLKDVRILNGGIQSWIDSGFQTTTKEYNKQPVKDFGAKIPSNPNIAVDLEEAEEILKNPGKNLVSVRSWREYIGEVSGYNYIEKKGRIPGSVFGNCGTDAYHMENYRNLDHTTREFHEIEEIWKEVGITPDKHNSFYCGTGWRGSEAFFNAWLMGWDDISVFDGGWFEWSKKGNTYETGVPKDGDSN
ncbi:MAG: rhodanese-like domain-containing protein [Candidatus Hodarchaeota archaeon]